MEFLPIGKHQKIEIDNHRLNIDDNSFLLEIDQEERMDIDDLFFKISL